MESIFIKHDEQEISQQWQGKSYSDNSKEGEEAHKTHMENFSLLYGYAYRNKKIAFRLAV